MGAERRSEADARRRAVHRRRVVAGAVAIVLAVGGGALAVAAATGEGGGDDGSSTGAAAGGARPTGTAAHAKGAKATKATKGKAAATSAGATTAARPLDLAHPLGPIPAAVSGMARIVSSGPAAGKGVALTFDDGYCDACVAKLVALTASTGAHVTFCPNGSYPAWAKQARRIRRLIALGQVTMCNHTWDHPDLRTLSDAEIEREITRNEDWMQRTFGVTARPFLRPPYGAYDDRVLAIAGRLGYTRVLLWSGTTADSTARTRDYVASAVRLYAVPGAIILAHGNHPGTADAFTALVRIVKQKGLKLMTVAELTTRGLGSATAGATE